jgi:predicted short-subunit dehydrogenase-like oxidoreductase (DUF2520 family)
VLSSAVKAGYPVASIHPIKSFADPALSVQSFKNTFCAIEGDKEAITLLEKLFSNIGGNLINISKENKPLYHAAGVIANNYLVTLHYHAVQCYKSGGIEEEVAKKIVSMLMNNALSNLNQLDHHQQALTGPLQRGDLQTVRNHLIALEDQPLVRDIYSHLGLATLPLTRHSPEVTAQLEKELLLASSHFPSKLTI